MLRVALEWTSAGVIQEILKLFPFFQQLPFPEMKSLKLNSN